MSARAGAIVFLILVLSPLIGLAGWFILRTIRRAEDPAKMLFKWCITLPIALLCLFSVSLLGPLGPFLIVGCAVVLSILWAPHLGAGLAKPLTSIIDGGDEQPEERPLYSVARARQKRGRYTEAIAEIRKQLDRFPTDIEGQMLLAEIQAEDLKDLPGAQLTIDRLCGQPGHAPKNIVYARYSLADWHLKIGQDREAAKRELEKVVEALPDTEFALGAAQRIAHLGSPEMLLAPHERKVFAVVPGIQNVGLAKAQELLLPVEADPAQTAVRYVSHLEQHPQDTEAREKLAVIYADHYQRLDLAADQLEQMIEQPNQPAKQVVRWLNLLADLQVRHGADYETVRDTLERIVARDPNAAAAELARKRQDLIRLELKANEKNQAIKLGTYEQNIGLKRGPGRPTS